MDTNPAGAARPTAPDQEELRLLADQLARMRGMPSGYSGRFLDRILTCLVPCLAPLVALDRSRGARARPSGPASPD